MTDRSQPQREQPVRPLTTQSSLARDVYFGGPNLRLQTERRPSLPVGGTGPGLSSGVALPPVPRSAGPDVTTFARRGPERFEHDNFVVYLSIDLEVLKISEPLRQYLGGQDLHGQSLHNLVHPNYHGEIQALENQLREERLQTDPMGLPAIRGADQLAVQSLDETDVDRVTSTYREKEGYWQFRFPNGRQESLKYIVSLARTSTFFVAMILRPLSAMSAAAPGPGFQTIRSQPAELAAPVPTNPVYTPGPRDTHFAPPGPSSPFHRTSAPSSPFSTMPQHLSTTLPPVPSGHTSASPSREQQFGSGGYFSRQPPPTASPGARMQPPPQPPSLTRSSSVREPRRPAPLENLNLPPILSSSAPTTPNNPETVFEPGSSGGAYAPGSSTSGLDSGSQRRIDRKVIQPRSLETQIHDIVA